MTIGPGGLVAAAVAGVGAAGAATPTPGPRSAPVCTEEPEGAVRAALPDPWVSEVVTAGPDGLAAALAATAAGDATACGAAPCPVAALVSVTTAAWERCPSAAAAGDFPTRSAEPALPPVPVMVLTTAPVALPCGPGRPWAAAPAAGLGPGAVAAVVGAGTEVDRTKGGTAALAAAAPALLAPAAGNGAAAPFAAVACIPAAAPARAVPAAGGPPPAPAFAACAPDPAAAPAPAPNFAGCAPATQSCDLLESLVPAPSACSSNAREQGKGRGCKLMHNTFHPTMA